MKRNTLLLNGILCLSIGTLLIGSLGACKKNRSDTSKNTAIEAQKGSELGDLSAFKKIAEDTLALVEKDQLADAKSKIKELETAWDDAESQMKPLNSEKWNSLDKSIDRALAQLRTAQPDQASSSAALKKLIAKFTAMNTK